MLFVVKLDKTKFHKLQELALSRGFSWNDFGFLPRSFNSERGKIIFFNMGDFSMELYKAIGDCPHKFEIFTFKEAKSYFKQIREVKYVECIDQDELNRIFDYKGFVNGKIYNVLYKRIYVEGSEFPVLSFSDYGNMYRYFRPSMI